MDNKKIIGSRINSALAMNNTLQKELAKQLNVKDNIVSYWCKGERTPNTSQIIQIANCLNVSTDYLLGLSDVATNDKDLQFICDYTGLSEKVITIFNTIFTKNNYYGFSLRFNEACKKNPNLPQITANKILSSRFFLNLIDFMIIQESLNSDIASCLNLIERNADYNECSKYINLCDEQDLNIYRAQTDVFELLKSKMNYNSDDLIKIKSYIYDKSIENELK